MVVLQWLKNYLVSFSWKDFIYLSVIVVLFIFYVRGHQSSNQVIVEKPVYKPVETKTDKKGNQYTEIKGVLFTSEQVKHLTDSIAKVLGVKPKDISGITSTTTTIDTYAHTTNTVYLDTFNHTINDSISTKEYKLSYQADYRARTGNFHLQLSPDTATYVNSICRHLFREDEINIKIYHSNKLFTPQEGYAYSTKLPKTIAVVGPFIGVAYTGKIVPVIGLSLTFNLIGIKKK